MRYRNISIPVNKDQLDWIQKLIRVLQIGTPSPTLMERAFDIALTNWAPQRPPAPEIFKFAGEILLRITPESLQHPALGGKVGILLGRWVDFVLEGQDKAPQYQNQLVQLRIPVQRHIEDIGYRLLRTKQVSSAHAVWVAMAIKVFPARSFPYDRINTYIKAAQEKKSATPIEKDSIELLIAGIITCPQELHYPGYFFKTILEYVAEPLRDNSGLITKTVVADHFRWPSASEFRLHVDTLSAIVQSIPRSNALNQLVIQLLTHYWSGRLLDELGKDPVLSGALTDLIGDNNNTPLQNLQLSGLVLRFLQPTSKQIKKKINTLTRHLLRELPTLEPWERRPIEIFAAEGLIHRRAYDLESAKHEPQEDSVLSWCILRNIRPATSPPEEAYLIPLLDTLDTQALPSGLFVPLINDVLDAKLSLSLTEAERLISYLVHPSQWLSSQARRGAAAHLGVLSPYLSSAQFKTMVGTIKSPTHQVAQLDTMLQHCVSEKSNTHIGAILEPINSDWIKATVQAPHSVWGQLLGKAIDTIDPTQDSLLTLPHFDRYSEHTFKALSALKEWNQYPLAEKTFKSAITHWMTSHPDESVTELVDEIMPALVNHDGFLWSDESAIRPLFPETLWADLLAK